jgi:hypothetical protein
LEPKNGPYKKLNVAKLKKQSQFVPSVIYVKSYLVGVYSNILAGGAEKNKANQSQFQYRQAGSSFIIGSMLDTRCSPGIGK